MKRASLGVVTLLLGACVCFQAAPAWRPRSAGNLAKPQMAFDLNPAQSALRAHAYSSREAGESGNAGAGGGCGCY